MTASVATTPPLIGWLERIARSPDCRDSASGLQKRTNAIRADLKLTIYAQLPMTQTSVRPRSSPIAKARNLFVFAAFASFVFSVSLWFTGSREEGQFVGLWVPSILAFGCLMTAGKE